MDKSGFIERKGVERSKWAAPGVHLKKSDMQYGRARFLASTHMYVEEEKTFFLLSFGFNTYMVMNKGVALPKGYFRLVFKRLVTGKGTNGDWRPKM